MSPHDHPSRSGAGAGWHAAPALLAAYAGGRAGPVDSWSLEMHLVSCALCRAELALAMRPAEQATLQAVRARVVADTRSSPQPSTSWTHRTRALLGPDVPRAWSARARLVLQPAALAAVLVAVLLAVGLDLLTRTGGPAGGTGGGLLWLLAPALPLSGVALCSVAAGDPCGEAILATPSAGLRLTLWRTLAVLAVAVPAAIAIGVAIGAPQPGLWLLPCLALTITALALGTVIGLERAAAVSGGAWCALVLGPALLEQGGLGLTALQSVAAAATDAPAVGPVAQGLWATTAVTAALVLLHRRASYEHLSPAHLRSAA